MFILVGGQRWPAGLFLPTFSFPVTLSYTGMSFGYLEGHLTQPPLVDGELRSGGRNQLVGMWSMFLTFSWSVILSSLRSGSRMVFGPWTISIRVSWSSWFLLSWNWVGRECFLSTPVIDA